MNLSSTPTVMSHPLDRYTEAVLSDGPDAGQSDAAQRHLMARIEASRNSRRSPAPAWRWATAAVLVILVVPVLVMMPGSNGSVAFAEVQSYFTDFETMQARMTTRMNGNTVLAMDIVVDEHDRVRLDSGSDFSFVIDPNQQVMLQLFHAHKRAVRVPLQGDEPADAEAAIDWLDRIREYQGQSRLVEESRTIDGSEAFGFRMTDQAVDMTLWATEAGRPVLLEMRTGPESALATTEIRFSFDEPVSPERFSLVAPEGYAVHTGSDEG